MEDKEVRSLSSSQEINKTYIISSLTSRSDEASSAGRLTLQRRNTNSKPTPTGDQEASENAENQNLEKRLTLQRRTRPGGGPEKSSHPLTSSVPEKRAWTSSKVLSEPNNRTGSASPVRSASLKERGVKSSMKDLTKPTVGTPGKITEKAQSIGRQQNASSTPTGKTQFQRITLKKDVFEKLSAKEPARALTSKQAASEKQKQSCSESSGAPIQGAGDKKVAVIAQNRSTISVAMKKTANQLPAASKPPVFETRVSGSQAAPLSSKELKTENSAVTVAVRVRPLSHREKNENGRQMIFMEKHETVVQHPDTKQTYTFSFDFCFYSADENDPTFAGQQTIYEKLARPLLERAFEGFNTCLFAYGQTGSGKSYTMMGFGEEVGVIPRFCEELFVKVSSAIKNDLTCHLEMSYFEVYNEKIHDLLVVKDEQNQKKMPLRVREHPTDGPYVADLSTMMGFGEEVGVIPRFCEELFVRVSSAVKNDLTCHLEMSYFEVYNEKIHDLLVVKDEQNQKKMPLRVREHPTDGPYVADLSTNVVTSYTDVQTWLELGNKQRATAATGMNDKSSRSHSVFTLVMTQTKTELVEGEEHDHRIISRINLVDLAGSERCTTAQTSGDRLREGASINKSLLTLGKVICSLSEQAQARKKIFIPYRESVLTWLLKESLGGNSKTAMIATLSPATSNIDESLSTLRYAQQARLIINVAKVNEDNNAKLIRELKSEVEKLRAAQMSSQGIEPEKMRQFQQEIFTLKSQLSQQEREMAEVHRKWKEKLEHAERRKHEETKELQAGRVGITFKVDNRLPNLVNLNEDPQLSEMLLYMIKEGQTKVGKLKSESAHDIQLTGALIADEHCVISNFKGTVSITPMESAKTFVNGNLVLETTILHHGDRVILGGDHYFRFNHPAEVQCGKRASCWSNGDGQKDFEFAKNELLSAQRAQLEAEIEDARLKAKEEMMQGIQVAREMAQKELCDQKLHYENQIKNLEKELEEENERKRAEELERQKVASKMEELQSAKSFLEQEMSMHKKRLQMEAQAARQAMFDNDIRHAKILEALEAEKRKIAEDLTNIQKKRALKVNQTPKSAPPQWDAMKLSLMIEEANKISTKFRKHTVFGRHEVSEAGNAGGNPETQIQVQNTKLGISTFWSMEKFQSNLAVMRELERGVCASKDDDDVFYDPNDHWEPDISSASTESSFSRRRSRSLLKSRRISGRLYEIRVHPIQSLNCTSSEPTGLISMSKSPAYNSSSSHSTLPSVCKDLIAATVSCLRTRSSAEESESLADKLALDLLSVFNAANSITGLYEQLDDNSQENLFACNTEALSHLVRATSAIERAVFITRHWISSVTCSTQSVSQTMEELKSEVKNTGGYFQLLIQGCESEISSMVTEAQRKIIKSTGAALSATAHLAAVTGMHLLLPQHGSDTIGKRTAGTCVREGTCRGVRALQDEALFISREMLRHAQLAQPRAQILQSLKVKMQEVAKKLQSYIHCTTREKPEPAENDQEGSDTVQMGRLRNTASKLFQLNHALQQLHSSLSLTLRGRGSDVTLRSFRDTIQSLTKTVSDLLHGLPRQTDVRSAEALQLPCLKSVMDARDDLHSALCSLAELFDESIEENLESTEIQEALRNRTVPKIVYSLSSGVSSCSRDVRWV
ncbi:kinesin-like protein KIF14 [Silurus meridionalis]|nr:kinesin-like protein KIF14 [Silurus meridionalis]